MSGNEPCLLSSVLSTSELFVTNTSRKRLCKTQYAPHKTPHPIFHTIKHVLFRFRLGSPAF